MKIRKIIGRVMVMMTVALPYKASAQTVAWLLPPGEYSGIVRMGNDLYRATRGGMVGLLRADGTAVAPISNGAISRFYDHKALLTYTDGQRECIRGCLTDDGKYYPFSKKYYTLNGQKFYSDGLLSVADDSGRLGYIDCYGNEALGFDGKYDRIKPFVEGYAAVFKNKQYHLINKSGTQVRFLFKGVAEVYGGTNMTGGVVYVWDTDGKLYTFNPGSGATCVPARWPQSRSLDYLYRFESFSKCGKEVPYTDATYSGVKGISPVMQGGLYGYSNGATVIAPCQFASASPFENNTAVVSVNGKTGILKYIDGESFAARQTSGTLRYFDGESVKCSFSLSVPSVWQGKSLTVSVRKGDNTMALSKSANGSYSFTERPTGSNATYQIEVEADGLRLFSEALAFNFTKKTRCATCRQDIMECRYRGKHPVAEPRPAEKRVAQPEKHAEKLCPTCGKKISECKYQGVH